MTPAIADAENDPSENATATVDRSPGGRPFPIIAIWPIAFLGSLMLIALTWAAIAQYAVDPGPVSVKSPTPEDPAILKLKADVRIIEGQVGDLTHKIAAQGTQLTKAADDINSLDETIHTQGGDLKKLKVDLDENENLTNGQLADRKNTNGKVAEAINLLKTEVGGQKTILVRISRHDAKGTPIVDLNANMQNPEFHRDFADAVGGVVPPQTGVVRVYNQTPIPRQLRINGRMESITAHSTASYSIPVGSLVTELVGYEGPKTWTIGPRPSSNRSTSANCLAHL